MSLYAVVSLQLAPVSPLHNGSGQQHDPARVTVNPDSVPGATPLRFVGMDVGVTTLLFAIEENVVPNWFGVAVPDGVTDFSNANIFFHPTPRQAGYNDADYSTKGGKRIED
jgi:hypothetical protein